MLLDKRGQLYCQNSFLIRCKVFYEAVLKLNLNSTSCHQQSAENKELRRTYTSLQKSPKVKEFVGFDIDTVYSGGNWSPLAQFKRAIEDV